MKIIAVVVTSRASWARVASVVDHLRGAQLQGRCQLSLIWAGSAVLPRYGDISAACDERIFNVLEGETLETMAAGTGLLTFRMADVFARIKPDLVLLCADRHEVLAPAIAASYANIPIAHLLAGERTGSIDDRVRDAISMLASMFFPPTEQSAARLRCLGVRGPIWMYGCPSLDLCRRVEEPVAVAGPVPLVVCQHAVTTEYEYAYDQALATVEAVRTHQGPVVWLWPGEDAGGYDVERAIRTYANTSPPNVTFRRHIPVMEFLTLLKRASCLIGNSSVGIRECSFLGVPVVNVGSRQANRERGPNVIDVPHDTNQIRQAIYRQIIHGRYEPSFLYGRGDAGQKIAEALLCSGA